MIVSIGKAFFGWCALDASGKMPKRKRGHDAGHTTGIPEPDVRRQSANLRDIIERSTKTLASALKLARGFERQKLGRRQKQAFNEPQNLLRLREEVILLKQLHLEQTASNYLIKHLSKTKRVRESPVFEAVYGLEPQLETVRPGAEANVVGRLVNSTPVKQVMTQIMDTVYKTLGLQDADIVSKAFATSSIKTEPRVESVEVQRETAFEGFSPADSTNGSEEELPSASDTGEELPEGYKDMIADSNSDHNTSPLSYSGSVSRSTSPDTGPTTRSRLETSFLPALSMGGYYSGSDSSDAGEHNEAVAAKSRKNRRGQRARQQLAELKYGKNARHLQQQDAKSPRNVGWDAQRGAVDRSDKRRRGPNRESGAQVTAARSANGKNAARNVMHEKQKPSPRDDAGPLHPSWEAAKLRKSQSTAQAKFSGKKIMFD